MPGTIAKNVFGCRGRLAGADSWKSFGKTCAERSVFVSVPVKTSVLPAPAFTIGAFGEIVSMANASVISSTIHAITNVSDECRTAVR